MEINWIAVIVAALSTFVLGFIWYNPKVFGTMWQKAAGLSDEQMKDMSGMGKIFGVSFILALAMAIMTTYFVHGTDDIAVAARMGLYLGLGIILPAMGTTAMYERRGFAYIFVNGAYWIIGIIIISMILAAFN
ncbi:DUF1761 domain-containing protein [Phaeocystidibacter luteus]|uniref:DUF1761 domain-containing protein n=1 Tax=Phaeocystidibacter luteus TaxID=911197 RepID=A0A6N6REG3_9FLAO|nr:DUF1761 domain-containing protein [Phaeocystidibacter luteus]KAB2808041.1 DUF1761 domain-containing protein [Phaeocystidibacter luteus]